MRNKRVLFVCHLGRMRSRTAAEVFAKHTRLDTNFAGTGAEAVRPVSEHSERATAELNGLTHSM